MLIFYTLQVEFNSTNQKCEVVFLLPSPSHSSLLSPTKKALLKLRKMCIIFLKKTYSEAGQSVEFIHPPFSTSGLAAAGKKKKSSSDRGRRDYSLS